MDWLNLPRRCHLSTIMLVPVASVTFREARPRHSAPFAFYLNFSATIVLVHEPSTLDRLGHRKTFAKRFSLDCTLLSRS